MIELAAREGTPQGIVRFGEKENAWLGHNDNRAHELSLKYGSGGQLDPEELDRIFAGWASEDGEKESGETISNALGAAFGEFFAEKHGFWWVVVRDEYGTEYAVRHEVGETMSFPRASVEKRIEGGQTEEFLDSLYRVILDHCQRSQAAAESPQITDYVTAPFEAGPAD